MMSLHMMVLQDCFPRNAKVSVIHGLRVANYNPRKHNMVLLLTWCYCVDHLSPPFLCLWSCVSPFLVQCYHLSPSVPLPPSLLPSLNLLPPPHYLSPSLPLSHAIQWHVLLMTAGNLLTPPPNRSSEGQVSTLPSTHTLIVLAIATINTLSCVDGTWWM